MGLRLSSVDGEKPIKLDKPILLIGRNPECDVVLTVSRKVSRIHCFVACVGHRIYVRDLASTNGVWVNGHRVEREQRVRIGDELSVADIRFLLEETPDVYQESRREKKPSREPEPNSDDSIEPPLPPRQQRDGMPVRRVRPLQIDPDARQPIALPEEDDSFVVEPSLMNLRPDDSDEAPRKPKRPESNRQDAKPPKREVEKQRRRYDDESEDEDNSDGGLVSGALLDSLMEEDDDDDSRNGSRRRRK